MTGQADPRAPDLVRAGKYARIERERRFLLAGPPPTSAVTASRRITDRYLPRTRLRLRRVDHPDSGIREFKLTQKAPAARPGFVHGLITNTYLSEAEYDLLATPPAEELGKSRLCVPPLSIDVFGPPLQGLVLADSEFSTDEAAQSFAGARWRSPKSPTTPASPEAVSSGPAATTCSTGSPSSA